MGGWGAEEVVGEGLVVRAEVVDVDLEPVLTEARVSPQLLAVQEAAARLPRVALQKVLVAAQRLRVLVRARVRHPPLPAARVRQSSPLLFSSFLSSGHGADLRCAFSDEAHTSVCV